jgi:glutamate-1-semialdehyde 2,1-aminomutase
VRATEKVIIDGDRRVELRSCEDGVPGAALGMTEAVARRAQAKIDPEFAGMGGIGGTLAANALSLAAMRITLDEILTASAYAHMARLGQRWAAGVEDVITRRGLPWHVVRIGGRVEYHFSPLPLRDGAGERRSSIERSPVTCTSVRSIAA